MNKRITKEEVKIRLLNKHKRVLSESQYNTCMIALGYTYDEELGKYFKGDSAFIMNLADEVTEVGQLMTIKEYGQLSYFSEAVCDFINRGGKLTIGDGAIGLSGKKYKKGLYCTNYRELFSDKSKVKSKKIED